MAGNKTYISFYMRSSSIHIFCNAVREIGSPPYIRFLVHEEDAKIIMQSYDKREFISLRVPAAVYQRKGSMELRSIRFCRLLSFKMGWDSEESYRVPGRIYPRQKLVEFDLSKAALIRNP